MKRSGKRKDRERGVPFEARSGGLFGLVDRYDDNGFYGAADPGKGTPIPGGQLPAPELIIQAGVVLRGRLFNGGCVRTRSMVGA